MGDSGEYQCVAQNMAARREGPVIRLVVRGLLVYYFLFFYFLFFLFFYDVTLGKLTQKESSDATSLPENSVKQKTNHA